MKSKEKIKVLLVVANPISTTRLRLDTEIREIQQSLERGKIRDNISLVIRPAVTIIDFHRALLEETFQIIHISGHGTQNGLIFSNEQGGQYTVQAQTLADTLNELPITCVLLNACYSIHQGELLTSIPFSIAMEGPITDSVAIAFSGGFYDAVAAGRSIDYAYHYATKRVKFLVSHATQVPTLINKGKIISPSPGTNQNPRVAERSYLRKGKFLVGFAIDLSGSMDQSIRNQTGIDTSRLRSLDQSLSDLMKHARESIRESQSRGIETSLDLFAYGFGLRALPVCDLLSLYKAGRELITRERITTYAESYKREQLAKLPPYTTEAAEAVKSVGLGELWAFGEDYVKRVGRDAVLKRFLREMRPKVEARAKEIGDTTLSFEEVAQLWESSEVTLNNVKEFILGNTPIREVLAVIVGRFQHELQIRDQKTESILFLVSDGKFTDVDPLPLARKLHAMGVSIVSCFLSNQDTANPRELRNNADPQWGAEAKLMFEMASPMGDLPEVHRYLLNNNWTINPNPKLFVQLNHSDVLREFVHVTLRILEESDAAHTLPRGW